MKKKLVIIGSGISGLSAAFYLHKKFEITLIEQNSYLGGHTHTHNLKIKNEKIKYIELLKNPAKITKNKMKAKEI